MNLPLRPDVKESLDLYATKGILPGGFLQRVLCNDLFGAFEAADSYNAASLQTICGYIYNELPATCWGSELKVRTFIENVRARLVDELKLAHDRPTCTGPFAHADVWEGECFHCGNYITRRRPGETDAELAERSKKR